jgi:hypothetical protein
MTDFRCIHVLFLLFGYVISPTEDFLNDCGYYQLRLKQINNAIDIFAELLEKLGLFAK